MIEAYFSELEKTLQDFPNICFYSLSKKIYNAKQGFINGSILFNNGYRLEFVEVKDIEVQPKMKYRHPLLPFPIISIPVTTLMNVLNLL